MLRCTTTEAFADTLGVRLTQFLPAAGCGTEKEAAEFFW